MAKVDVTVYWTKTTEHEVTVEMDVPQYVLDDGDQLTEWLDREKNQSKWQNHAEAVETDETFELNEAYVEDYD